MVVPVIIDTSSLVEAYSSITPEQVDRVCDNIAKTLAARYASTLENEANAALHQTRKIYVQNIHVVDTGKMEGTVILDYSKNPLVRMIEEGMGAWDMKDKMLNSQKAKVSKNGGRYITIPFRIGTPGIVGDSDVFSSVMPADVYEVAKELVAPKGGVSNPLLVGDLPAKYQTPATRPAIKDSAGKVLFKAYQHKTSIYAGITKNNDATTGQNTYNSFRRISEEITSPEGERIGSDPDSWINKGIERHDLVQKALSNFNTDTEVTTALSSQLSQLGL